MEGTGDGPSDTVSYAARTGVAAWVTPGAGAGWARAATAARSARTALRAFRWLIIMFSSTSLTIALVYFK